MSKRAVRQDDPLGPLLFAPTLQPVLEQINAACEEAPLVLYLVNMPLSGKITPAFGAFRRLCMDDAGVRSVGLDPQLPRCGIYGGHKELVAAEAAKLRIAHQLDGSTAAGTPLGSAEYVCNALVWRAATVETLADTGEATNLCTVPVPAPACHTASTHDAPHADGASRGARDARTLQCGGRQRLCSKCLRGWVNTVPTWRARTGRAARWVCR